MLKKQLKHLPFALFCLLTIIDMNYENMRALDYFVLVSMIFAITTYAFGAVKNAGKAN